MKSVAVSSSAGIVACHGGVQGQAEVKLVETSTGRVVGSLQQAAHVEHVSSVTLSASGRWAEQVFTPILLSLPSSSVRDGADQPIQVCR